MSSGSAEEAADRALSSVSRKLDKTLSVEYTINQLVTAATSIENLSLIFPGSYYHFFSDVDSSQITQGGAHIAKYSENPNFQMVLGHNIFMHHVFCVIYFESYIVQQ